MSRTVSARIPNKLHDELRERCNKAGCSINDWLVSAIEYLFTGSSEFDFGDPEEEEFTKEDESKLNQDHKPSESVKGQIIRIE